MVWLEATDDDETDEGFGCRVGGHGDYLGW
jgi:hypothetical protein